MLDIDQIFLLLDARNVDAICDVLFSGRVVFAVFRMFAVNNRYDIIEIIVTKPFGSNMKINLLG